ncbi:MAG TPA: lysozyme inhibitor LprI family protein [Solirubrobacteraceae bacterium]|jgi:uncharacterized protein YecT (DUF1311 family)|nr:lysozyme inhibitor LprI family protein [Solirubrobacteraceae bacterium]
MTPRRFTKPRLAATAAATAVLAVLATAQPAALAAATLAAPVIHETFTPLACPTSKAQAGTTLGMEGCLEQATLKADAQIDALAKQIFPLLGSNAARRRFVTAQRDWLTYRNADCASVSDKYAGGTLAGVVAAQCTAQRTARHLTDVRAFEKLLKTP